ncbi:MAG: hypothetical protein Q9191_007208, partial [Dirinaria sp. TL-2023a]
MAGRKRANSADQARTLKRPKADHEATKVNGNKASRQTPRNRRNRDTSVSAQVSQKKPKVDKHDASNEKSKESGGEPSFVPPKEARPELGTVKLVQAVPASAEAADNRKGKTGQGKVDSWQAFKAAALKLREAGHTSVKIEIDENTPLFKFFPLLPRRVFDTLPFKNCALEYRFESEGGKPAGASLIAEVELSGPLGRLSDVFTSVLGQEESVFRVTAFLGVVLDYDKDIAIESLTLAGCFVGCNIQYPAASKLLRITSLGASISIAKNGEAGLLDAAKAAILPNPVEENVAGKITAQEQLAIETATTQPTSIEDTKPIATHDITRPEVIEDVIMKIKDEIEAEEEDGEVEEVEESTDAEADDEDDGDEDEEKVSHYINYSIFGTVELPVPGQPLALALDLDVSVVKDMMVLTMSPKGEKKAWDNVFGFDNFDSEQLVNVLFKVGYPLGTKDGESKGDDEDESKKIKDEKQESKKKTASVGREKSRIEKGEEDAKKEKEFADLMHRFEMERGAKNDTQPFVALQAGWESSVGEVTIYGKITKDFVSSSIKGTLHNVTFAKIKKLFETTHNVSLGDTDIDIQAKKLTVELSKEGVRLEGDLTIYGKEVTAKLLLSTEGVSLSAGTP